MATPRALIVQALDATIPADVDVRPYDELIDNLATGTAMVSIDTARPNRDTAQAKRTYTASVLVLAATTTPGPADDELDALLEDVLAALDQADGLDWTEAKRATYQERWPAYDITVTVDINQE